MSPVEIIIYQDVLILRARGSELLIVPQHVEELKKLKEAKAFASYFTESALVNRPARKLFEAWLRKDGGLWKRTYQAIQTMKSEAAAAAETVAALSPVIEAEAEVEPVVVEAASPVKKARKKAAAKKS